jgi:hypothetical protein
VEVEDQRRAEVEDQRGRLSRTAPRQGQHNLPSASALGEQAAQIAWYNEKIKMQKKHKTSK